MLLRTAVALALVFAGQKMVQAGIDTEIAKGLEMCDELFSTHSPKGGKKCCKGMHELAMNFTESHVKCALPAPGEDWKCEHSECMMKKTGMLKEDRTLDFKQVEKGFDDFVNLNPATKPVVDKVREECTEKNLIMMRDDCAALDFQTCVLLSFVTTCPEWDENDSHCKDVLEKVTTCKAAMLKFAAKGG